MTLTQQCQETVFKDTAVLCGKNGTKTVTKRRYTSNGAIEERVVTPCLDCTDMLTWTAWAPCTHLTFAFEGTKCRQRGNDEFGFEEETCDSEQIVSSTSYGCPGGPQSSDSAWCRSFPAENIFLLDVDRWNDKEGSRANYWLTENGKAGGDQAFIMYLGCTKTVKGVVLRNTHNAGHHDRSTKKFRILGSSHIDGSWQELLVAHLEDSRRQNLPPVQQLKFASPAVVSFIKFEMLEMWGFGGGGLQYFALI